MNVGDTSEDGFDEDSVDHLDLKSEETSVEIPVGYWFYHLYNLIKISMQIEIPVPEKCQNKRTESKKIV